MPESIPLDDFRALAKRAGLATSTISSSHSLPRVRIVSLNDLIYIQCAKLTMPNDTTTISIFLMFCKSSLIFHILR